MTIATKNNYTYLRLHAKKHTPRMIKRQTYKKGKKDKGRKEMEERRESRTAKKEKRNNELEKKKKRRNDCCWFTDRFAYHSF